MHKMIERLPTQFAVPPGCDVEVYRFTSWDASFSYTMAEYICWCGSRGSAESEMDAVNDLVEHLYTKHRQWPAREF